MIKPRALRFHVDGARLSDPLYLLGICSTGIREGWLHPSTHACIEVFRIAAHARVTGSNPARLFAFLIRQQADGTPVTVSPRGADLGDTLWRASRDAVLQSQGGRPAELRRAVSKLARELAPHEAERMDPVRRVALAAGPAGGYAREALLSVCEAGVGDEIRDSVAVRTAVYLAHGCPRKRAVRLALDYERKHGSAASLRPQPALAG